MVKLGCNSQEGIKDFIENSDQFSSLRGHYNNLCIRAEFEKTLDNIRSLVKEQTSVCLFLLDDNQEKPNLLFNQLERHLTLSVLHLFIGAKDHYIADLAKTANRCRQVVEMEM